MFILKFLEMTGGAAPEMRNRRMDYYLVTDRVSSKWWKPRRRARVVRESGTAVAKICNIIKGA